MITNSYRKILACLLSGHGAAYTHVPITDALGATVYIGGTSTIGNNTGLTAPTTTPILTNTATSYGIKFGSGTTAATASDYELESLITSGASITRTDADTFLDNDGNPYVVLRYTVTNTSSSADLTIAEVGSFQQFAVATTEGGTTAKRAVMVDRTLLDTPLVITPQNAAVVTYTLKSILPV